MTTHILTTEQMHKFFYSRRGRSQDGNCRWLVHNRLSEKADRVNRWPPGLARDHGRPKGELRRRLRRRGRERGAFLRRAAVHCRSRGV